MCLVENKTIQKGEEKKGSQKTVPLNLRIAGGEYSLLSKHLKDKEQIGVCNILLWPRGGLAKPEGMVSFNQVDCLRCGCSHNLIIHHFRIRSRAFGSVYSLSLTVAFCWWSAAELVWLLVLTQWAFLILSTSTSSCPCDSNGRWRWLLVRPVGVPASVSCLHTSTCRIRLWYTLVVRHHSYITGDADITRGYYPCVLFFTEHATTQIRWSCFCLCIPDSRNTEQKCVFQTDYEAEN